MPMRGVRGGERLPAPAQQEPMQGVRGGEHLPAPVPEGHSLHLLLWRWCRRRRGQSAGETSDAGKASSFSRKPPRLSRIPSRPWSNPPIALPIALARSGSAGVTQHRGAATAKNATATVAATLYHNDCTLGNGWGLSSRELQHTRWRELSGHFKFVASYMEFTLFLSACMYAASCRKSCGRRRSRYVTQT